MCNKQWRHSTEPVNHVLIGGLTFQPMKLFVIRSSSDGAIRGVLAMRMAYKYLSKEILIGFDKYKVT